MEAQAAFDRLKAAPARPQVKKRSAPGSFGRVEELELISRHYEQRENEPRAEALEERTREATSQAMSKRAARKERSSLPEAESAGGQRRAARASSPSRASWIRSSSVSWTAATSCSSARSGATVSVSSRARSSSSAPFLEGVVGRAFDASALATTSNLAAAWDGDLLWAVGAAQ